MDFRHSVKLRVIRLYPCRIPAGIEGRARGIAGGRAVRVNIVRAAPEGARLSAFKAMR